MTDLLGALVGGLFGRERSPCQWGHKWSTYSNPMPGQQSIFGREWQHVMIQERHCERCNKRELRNAA